MAQEKALIRELIERIDGVDQTWFELEIEGTNRKKTLVVEVGFELDANSAHHLRAACDQIEHTYRTVIGEENADVVSKLRLVNRSQASGQRHSSERQPAARSSSGTQSGDKQAAGRHPHENDRRPQREGNVSSSNSAS